MVEFGAGMLLFEPLRLAVLESFLPNGSAQFGPPLCTIQLISSKGNKYSATRKCQFHLILVYINDMQISLVEGQRLSCLLVQLNREQQGQECLHKRPCEDMLFPV